MNQSAPGELQVLGKLAAIVASAGSELPSELLVEKAVQAVLEMRPAVESLSAERKKHFANICIVLLKKYHGKIETLLHALLQLATKLLDRSFDAMQLDILFGECKAIVKTDNISPECQAAAMRLVGALLSVLPHRDYLLKVTPGILSLILESVLGLLGPKEQFLRAAIAALETFVNTYVSSFYQEVKATVDHLNASKHAATVASLVSLQMPFTRAPREIQTDLSLHKTIHDKLCEAFYRLLRSPSLPKLLATCGQLYADLFVRIHSCYLPMPLASLGDLLQDLYLDSCSYHSAAAAERMHLSPAKIDSAMKRELRAIIAGNLSSELGRRLSLCSQLCRMSDREPQVGLATVCRLLRVNVHSAGMVLVDGVDAFDDIDACLDGAAHRRFDAKLRARLLDLV